MITRYWVVQTKDREYRYMVDHYESSMDALKHAQSEYKHLKIQGQTPELFYYCSNAVNA